ncbi:MAG: O-antigen ligase family protein [Acidimicrobiales bacterium]
MSAAPPLHHSANRRAGRLIERIGRRSLFASIGVGVLGAMATGSLVVAVAPALALVAVQLLRFQPVSRLFLVMVAATLLLDHPAEQPYLGQWRSPLHAIGELWFNPLSHTAAGVPLPLAPALLVTVWLAWRALTERQSRLGPTGRLYLRVSALAATTLLAAQVYGVARGGDLRQTFYQVSPMLLTIAVGVAACLLGNRQLLLKLERIVLVVAAVRALVCLYLYITVFRPSGESFLYVTTHSDSVLWVVALAMLTGKLIATFRLEPQRGRVALALLYLGAITANNRRLAWVELGVVVAYAVWATPPRLHRLRARVAAVAVPVLLVYTVIGLSAPPSRLFMPVQALNSVNDETDSSTMSREIENHNLFVTIQQGGLLGVGFGHEYTEQIVGPDISTAFPQYRYLPHNSLLGLIAFAGPVGFIGFWLPFVVAMGAAARLRSHPSRRLRAAGVWFAGAIIAYTLMAWGDIGLQSSLNTVLGAVGAGLAVRMVGDAPLTSRHRTTETSPAERSASMAEASSGRIPVGAR